MAGIVEDGADEKPKEGGGIVGGLVSAAASTMAGTAAGQAVSNVAGGATRAVGGAAKGAAKGAGRLLKGGRALFAGAIPLGHGGLMGGIMTSLSSFGTAIGTFASSLATLAGPVLLIVAALYAAYEIFKRLDFSAILKPLAKYFGILKDIVMTVGTVIFKGLMVVGKMLMEILYVVYAAFQKVFDGVAWLLQPLLDGLAFILTPVVDMFGKLWEATKPLVEAVGDFFDTLLQADSIFLELGRILKDAFLGMVAKIWNAIAGAMPKWMGMEMMEVPEKTVRPPAREDAPAPPPAAPPSAWAGCRRAIPT